VDAMGTSASDTDPEDLAATALAMARRFAAGATMWCGSPPWPDHARHVAVEFVHPVVTGTRALPAVVIDGEGAVDRLRVLAVAGDILVGLGPGDDPMLRSLMRRARAWGLQTVWIGAGPRPEAGEADFVLWSSSPDAPWSGDIVRTYHLLWELTHVCFAHPGLLRAAPEALDGGAVCVTCSDEGRLAEIVVVGDGGLAQVRTPAGLEPVDTMLLEDPRPGDLVLVHAGAAVTLVEAAVAGQGGGPQ